MTMDANGRAHRAKGLPKGVAGTFEPAGGRGGGPDVPPPPVPLPPKAVSSYLWLPGIRMDGVTARNPERLAADLEAWRRDANRRLGEYDAPVERLDVEDAGAGSVHVTPVFGRPPKRPLLPGRRRRAWDEARRMERDMKAGFDRIVA